MVNRSVPGYEFLIENIGVMSKKFYQKNTVIYDLGSSLCACSLSILEKLKNIEVQICAVDSSENFAVNTTFIGSFNTRIKINISILSNFLQI